MILVCINWEKRFIQFKFETTSKVEMFGLKKSSQVKPTLFSCLLNKGKREFKREQLCCLIFFQFGDQRLVDCLPLEKKGRKKRSMRLWKSKIQKESSIFLLPFMFHMQVPNNVPNLPNLNWSLSFTEIGNHSPREHPQTHSFNGQILRPHKHVALEVPFRDILELISFRPEEIDIGELSLVCPFSLVRLGLSPRWVFFSKIFFSNLLELALERGKKSVDSISHTIGFLGSGKELARTDILPPISNNVFFSSPTIFLQSSEFCQGP